MPAHTPPVAPVTIPIRQSTSVTAPLRSEISPSLQGAYDLAMEAWGGKWVGVQLHMPGHNLPPGLSALLHRQNPSLTNALGKSGQANSFVFSPTISVEQQASILKDLDHQVLVNWARDGWLSQTPTNDVLSASTVEGSNAGGSMEEAHNVSLSVSAESDFTGQAISHGMDPVALRWFALAHEAAHGEAYKSEQPFHEVGWDAIQNKSMNALMFTHVDHGDLADQVYSESFADAYGAMIALAMTNNAPSMQKTLSAILDLRIKVEDQEDKSFKSKLIGQETPSSVGQFLDLMGLADGHRTAAALGQVLTDVQSGKLDLKNSTPDQLIAKARNYASDSVVVFRTSLLGQGVANLDWARNKTDPGSWNSALAGSAGPAVGALELKEIQRATFYMILRYKTFSVLPKGQRPTMPSVVGYPLIDDLVGHDSQWFAQFQKLPSSEREAWKNQSMSDPETLESLSGGLTDSVGKWVHSYMASAGSVLEKKLTQEADQVDRAQNNAQFMTSFMNRLQQIRSAKNLVSEVAQSVVSSEISPPPKMR